MSLDGIQLRRVDSLAEAEEFMCWLGERRSVLAIDTETVGLAWHVPSFTRLVQFGDHDTAWTIGVDRWWALIDQALREYDRPITFWNAKFDLHALMSARLTLPRRENVHDGMFMHALLYPMEWHGLKATANKLIDPKSGLGATLLDQAKRQGGWDWATIPYTVPAYSVYAGLDTILTARLHELMYPQIEKRFLGAYEREMATSWIMFGTERRGLRVDLDYSERLYERYQREMGVLLGSLSTYGIDKPNSARQIEAALRSQAWEPQDFTDTGAPSLAKKVLQGLDHEVAKLVLEYRWREKYSSYVSKILTTNDNGIVYPSVNTFEARTGRMSVGSDKKEKGTGEIVSLPWQQIPHTYDVRRCVLPRNEGDDLHAIDYASQEIRILAHYSQEAGLIEAIKTGIDLHIYTAERIYGEPITKDDRRRDIAKMCRYLQVYGGGAEKLASSVGITVQEAEDFKSKDTATFPGIKQFMDAVIATGRSRYQHEGRAFIETWGGREAECDPEFAYKLTNYIIQGTAADLIKEKLVQLDSAGLSHLINLPIHDELLYSIPTDEWQEVIPNLMDIMSDHKSFLVPIDVDHTGPVPSWGHTKLKKGEVPWDAETAC